jgi:hypothetical protein
MAAINPAGTSPALQPAATGAAMQKAVLKESDQRDGAGRN